MSYIMEVIMVNDDDLDNFTEVHILSIDGADIIFSGVDRTKINIAANRTYLYKLQDDAVLFPCKVFLHTAEFEFGLCADEIVLRCDKCDVTFIDTPKLTLSQDLIYNIAGKNNTVEYLVIIWPFDDKRSVDDGVYNEVYNKAIATFEFLKLVRMVFKSEVFTYEI